MTLLTNLTIGIYLFALPAWLLITLLLLTNVDVSIKDKIIENVVDLKIHDIIVVHYLSYHGVGALTLTQHTYVESSRTLNNYNISKTPIRMFRDVTHKHSLLKVNEHLDKIDCEYVLLETMDTMHCDVSDAKSVYATKSCANVCYVLSKGLGQKIGNTCITWKC